jgi:hypothetical protein
MAAQTTVPWWRAISPATAAEPGVTGQQLEMFLRAMARGQHQFVAPLIASPVAARDLAYMLTGQAGEASVVASL